MVTKAAKLDSAAHLQSPGDDVVAARRNPSRGVEAMPNVLQAALLLDGHHFPHVDQELSYGIKYSSGQEELSSDLQDHSVSAFARFPRGHAGVLHRLLNGVAGVDSLKEWTMARSVLCLTQTVSEHVSPLLGELEPPIRGDDLLRGGDGRAVKHDEHLLAAILPFSKCSLPKAWLLGLHESGLGCGRPNRPLADSLLPSQAHLGKGQREQRTLSATFSRVTWQRP